MGIANSVHYHILHDEIKMPGNVLIEMAYQLCHLYPNWRGPIKVPVPILHAHNAANMVGHHMHAKPSEKMGDKLYHL